MCKSVERRAECRLAVVTQHHTRQQSTPLSNNMCIVSVSVGLAVTASCISTIIRCCY